MTVYGRNRNPGKIDALAFSGSYNSEVLSDLPLLFWTFDEASGTTVTDHSGYLRHGTISGSVTRNGISLYGTTPSTDLTAGDTTIAGAVWMNITNAISFEAILMLKSVTAHSPSPVLPFARYDTSGGLCWHIYVGPTGGMGVAVRNNSNTYQNPPIEYTLTNNVPVHVVGTRDVTTIKLFVNGVLVSSAVASGTILTGTAPISCNRIIPGIVRGQTVLGAVSLYNTALSDSRIVAHAKAAGFS